MVYISQQITDPFVWETEEYVFLRASNVYKLFDPADYGLKPTPPNTACWKGFVVHFLVKNKQLYVEKLKVHCEDGMYPAINGIEATYYGGFHEYNELNMPVTYTGKIIIGNQMDEGFYGRAFTGPHSYRRTYELVFRKGILKRYKETSGRYRGI